MTEINYTQDPGTGTQYTANSKRIINKNGSFNVVKKGLRLSSRNIYHTLIQMSWPRFLILIFTFLLTVNAAFAIIYSVIGLEQLGGLTSTTTTYNYLEAYYFSFQTFTTVGYGVLHPVGHLANIIAAFEAIFGWMSFAIITGMLYGRFSKPSARIMYSNIAVIAPYKNEMKSLQLRIANMRKSNLLEMQATVLLVVVERNKDNSILSRNFIDLKLERDSILFFPLNWTLVHAIDESSPFYNKTEQDLKDMDSEVLVLLKGFDDTFSQVVHSQYSYKCKEIVWGGKFKPAYHTHESGDIHLHFDKMHDFDTIQLD